MNLLDTNVLLRYLLQDIPSQGAVAAALIESDQEWYLTDVALVEIGFAMEMIYQMPRPDVVDVLCRLIMRKNILVYGLERELVWESLQECRSSRRVSYADALTAAIARKEKGTVFTFDARFPKGGFVRNILTAQPR